ncbi:hypothetical protein EGW08_016875 [Elysia chlorotica]|uniref:Cell adhesion molecule-related/down-regulated by oncogenes n=1 Tax=Elysia chlorotica TaxID=188477 RepID=A0A3S1B9K5_ELYCH|nr:hypothetical protein EGW08_016875 [Elysia chlorotica]
MGPRHARWPRGLLLVTLLVALLGCCLAEESVPKITMSPADTRVTEEDKVSLFCRASGEPAPTITWEISGEKINNNADFEISEGPYISSLRIKRARYGDHNKKYTCEAHNKLGNTRADADVYIYRKKDGPEGIPDGFPKFLAQPKLKSVEKDKIARLTCDVSGNPKPIISWLKDKMPIDRLDQRLTILKTGYLEIQKAQPSDEGTYECVASNVHGTAYSYGAMIYVKGECSLAISAFGQPVFASARKTFVEESTNTIMVHHHHHLHLPHPRSSLPHLSVLFLLLTLTLVPVCRGSGGPYPPRGLHASDVEPDSVTLRWVPDRSSGGPITSFVVQYHTVPAEPGGRPGEVMEARSTRPFTIVPRLTPNTNYSFQVLAENSQGRSRPSNAINIKTVILAPGSAPLNVRARADSDNTIIVTWDPPTITNGQLTAYKVYYTQSIQDPIYFWKSVEVPKNVYMVTLPNLEQNKTYSISATAMGGENMGPFSPPIQVTMQKGVPYQPMNLRAVAETPNSILLTWDPPEEKEIIKSYEVYVNETHFRSNGRVSISPPVTVYRMTNLTPDTVYNIKVSAKSARGEGPPSKTVQAHTQQFKPTGPPLGVTGITKSKNEIRVTWQPPAEGARNGRLLGYRLFVRQVGVAGSDQAETVVDRDVNTRDGVPRPNMETVLGGLETWTTYIIQVLAFTKVGDGPKSMPIEVKTDEDVPGPPENVEIRAINSTAMMVEWDPPHKPKGLIRGYQQIHYIEVDDKDGPKNGVPENSYEAGPASTVATIGGLKPDTRYLVMVAAYTRKGDGLRSQSRIHTTKGPVPSMPRTLNVALISEDPPQVKVTWQRPKETSGEIKNYRILWGPEGDTLKNVILNPDVYNYATNNLDRGRRYEFRVSASNEVGFGERAQKTIMTPDGVPAGAPQNLTAEVLTDTSVRLSWDLPAAALRNGEIIMYQVTYSKATEDIIEEDLNCTASFIDLVGLEMNTQYKFKIKAFTNKGAGPWSNEKAFNTFGQSNAVQNFHVTQRLGTQVKLSWEPPTDRQGFKQFYEDGQNKSLSPPPKNQNIEATRRSVTLEGLKPKMRYTFNMTAVFKEGKRGYTSYVSAETLIDVDAPEFLRTMKGIAVLDLKRASERNGPISHYHLYVVPKDGNWDKFTSEYSEQLVRPVSKNSYYIAAKLSALSLPLRFHLGNDHDYNGFKNIKLDYGKPYKVFLRAFSVDKGLFTSSDYSVEFTVPRYDQYQVHGNTRPHPTGIGGQVKDFDDADASALMTIVMPTCAGAVLFIIGCAIVCWIVMRKKNKSKGDPLEPEAKALMIEPPSYSVDPVEVRRQRFQTPAMMSHPPIHMERLAEHIDALKASDNFKFSQEYESIEPGQQFTWDNSNLELNKPKNRYANVIAYDHSRVILQPMEGVPGSDYVNANYMDGYRKQNAYIATQGPLPETFGDFWRMVWEQRSATIVMMTKLEERSRIKCDQYWPSRGAETYGLMHVQLVDVTELATYTMRVFHMSRYGFNEKREVRQFQFTAWPDHGVPDYPTPLLMFMRRVKASNPPDAGSVIVHCSAGVGRTGAFIVIDAMLERIKHEMTVDIYGHVTCLRAQRNYMVQTEDQYIFIHDALLEAVQCGNTEVPARNLAAHIQKLTAPEPGQAITGMELEFKRLANVKASPNRFVSANLAVNKFKNRLVNILPYETTRVCLQPIRGVDGSDYINASFIDGYRYKKAYVATQGPLAETTEDFWRMLWEHNSTIIVMLTKLREMGREKCHQYWPSERSARYQYFVVDPMTEYNMPQYILREFKVTDARDGQSRTIRQFQFTDWPEQGVPKSGEGFIDFIGQVHKTKEQFGQEGPISVHCSAGVGRTGVFITLSIVLERMRYEGVVDMFQTVKMLRTQRPAMVQTEDQFQFCYRAALEYLGSFDHYAN